MDATRETNSDRRTHIQLLRDYAALSVEDKNDEESQARLSEAVDSLHPPTTRNRLDALTIEVIDLLKEAREDHLDPIQVGRSEAGRRLRPIARILRRVGGRTQHQTAGIP